MSLTLEQLQTQLTETAASENMNSLSTSLATYKAAQISKNEKAFRASLESFLTFIKKEDDFSSENIPAEAIKEKINLIQNIIETNLNDNEQQLRSFNHAKIIALKLFDAVIIHSKQPLTLDEKRAYLQLAINQNDELLPQTIFQAFKTNYIALQKNVMLPENANNMAQLNKAYETVNQPLNLLFKPLGQKKIPYIQILQNIHAMNLVTSPEKRPNEPDDNNLFESSDKHWQWLHDNFLRLRTLATSNLETAIELDDLNILDTPINKHIQLFHKLLAPLSPEEPITKAMQVARLAKFMSNSDQTWAKYSDLTTVNNFNARQLEEEAVKLEKAYEQLWKNTISSPKPEEILAEINKIETEVLAIKQRYGASPTALDVEMSDLARQKIENLKQQLPMTILQATVALEKAKQNQQPEKIVKTLQEALKTAQTTKKSCDTILPPKGQPLPTTAYAIPKSGPVLTGEDPFNRYSEKNFKAFANAPYTFSLPTEHGYQKTSNITIAKMLMMLPRLPGMPPLPPKIMVPATIYAAQSLLSTTKFATVTYKTQQDEQGRVSQQLTISDSAGKKAQLNITDKAAQTLIRNAKPAGGKVYLTDFTQKEEKQTRKMAWETAAVYLVEHDEITQIDTKTSTLSHTRLHKSEAYQELIDELNYRIKSSNGYNFDFEHNIHTILKKAEEYKNQVEQENKQLAAMQKSIPPQKTQSSDDQSLPAGVGGGDSGDAEETDDNNAARMTHK